MVRVVGPGAGSGIRNLIFYPSWIPDSRVKQAPDPGSGSATLHFCEKTLRACFCRQVGVVGKFVEFFGPGVATLSIADRATIANMCPEYGK
jgi:hypothetical protein